MVGRFILGVGVALMLAGAASASDRLSGQQVKDFMMGVMMSGVLVETNERWYECVALSGDTVYNISGSVSTGYVEVEDTGRTCFTYPRPHTTSRSCYNVEMHSGKPVFVEVLSGIKFRVDSINEGFDQCPTSQPVS